MKRSDVTSEVTWRLSWPQRPPKLVVRSNMHMPTRGTEAADFKSGAKTCPWDFYHCCMLVYRAISHSFFIYLPCYIPCFETLGPWWTSFGMPDKGFPWFRPISRGIVPQNWGSRAGNPLCRLRLGWGGQKEPWGLVGSGCPGTWRGNHQGFFQIYHRPWLRTEICLKVHWWAKWGHWQPLKENWNLRNWTFSNQTTTARCQFKKWWYSERCWREGEVAPQIYF